MGNSIEKRREHPTGGFYGADNWVSHKACGCTRLRFGFHAPDCIECSVCQVRHPSSRPGCKAVKEALKTLVAEKKQYRLLPTDAEVEKAVRGADPKVSKKTMKRLLASINEERIQKAREAQETQRKARELESVLTRRLDTSGKGVNVMGGWTRNDEFLDSITCTNAGCGATVNLLADSDSAVYEDGDQTLCSRCYKQMAGRRAEEEKAAAETFSGPIEFDAAWLQRELDLPTTRRLAVSQRPESSSALFLLFMLPVLFLVYWFVVKRFSQPTSESGTRLHSEEAAEDIAEVEPELDMV